MSWEKVPFESLYIEPSRNGVYKSKEFHGQGYKIVNMGEIFGFEFIGNQGMNRIKMSDSEIERSGLVDGDLLFGRRSLIESGAGKCSIIVNPSETLTFESSIIRVRLDKNKANPMFYYYWFKSHIGRSGIKAIVSGTNVKGIRSSDLRNITVALPEKKIQDNIAAFFKKYDDLIENNRRRIQLLEESARLLYREWFVHLRFPGHEHVKIVDGVPEGWQSKKLGEVLTLNYGKALNADARVPGAYPVYGSSGVVGTHEKPLVPGPGIIVGRKRNVGSVYWSSKDFFPIDTVYFINAEQSNLHLYYALQHVQFINTDVAVPGLNRDMAYSRHVLIPSETILQSFITQATTIRQQIEKLADFSAKLVEARDLLLPRLMSGEISV